jgi:hypothetical protein
MRRIYRLRRVPVRRFYRRNYHRRPIGSGFSGKRFFKLKYSSLINSTTTGNFTVQHDDNPNNAIDWNNFASLFDYYRICAIKIRFVPSVTAHTTFQYTPGYIFHDANTGVTLAGITVDTTVGYENCKIVNMQRSWRYYRKTYRSIPVGGGGTSSISTRGYISTSNPVSTQSIILYGVNSMTVDRQIGQILVTLYVVGVARI